MADQSGIEGIIGNMEEYQRYCLRILNEINFMEKEYGKEMDSRNAHEKGCA